MTTEREPEVEIYVRADSADVLREVSDERTRHVEVEGWTEAHDDKHDKGELAGAAGVYAVNAAGILAGAAWLRFFNAVWPWSKQWWKPKTRRHDLIRAASLIVAECERIDRCALKGDGAADEPQPIPAHTFGGARHMTDEEKAMRDEALAALKGDGKS